MESNMFVGKKMKKNIALCMYIHMERGCMKKTTDPKPPKPKRKKPKGNLENLSIGFEPRNLLVAQRFCLIQGKKFATWVRWLSEQAMIGAGVPLLGTPKEIDEVLAGLAKKNLRPAPKKLPENWVVK